MIAYSAGLVVGAALFLIIQVLAVYWLWVMPRRRHRRPGGPKQKSPLDAAVLESFEATTRKMVRSC